MGVAAGTLGILAGGGQLPFLIAAAARRQGRRVVAVGTAGDTDPALANAVDVYRELKLGQLGKLIAFLKEQQTTQVVMAGTINKPRAMDFRPDWRAARIYVSMKARGDDSLLRALTRELEGEGMAVTAPHVLVPELLTPPGVLTRRRPSSEEWADIRYGWPLAKTLGGMDIGQTLVVRKAVIAAVEALEGTNACIERGGRLAGAGATVIKVFKPGQEERVDMPAIGLATIETMAAVGATCLAVEAGKSLFFDAQAAIAAADQAGIALVGVDHEGVGEG